LQLMQTNAQPVAQSSNEQDWLKITPVSTHRVRHRFRSVQLHFIQAKSVMRISRLNASLFGALLILLCMLG